MKRLMQLTLMILLPLTVLSQNGSKETLTDKEQDSEIYKRLLELDGCRERVAKFEHEREAYELHAWMLNEENKVLDNDNRLLMDQLNEQHRKVGKLNKRVKRALYTGIIVGVAAGYFIAK